MTRYRIGRLLDRKRNRVFGGLEGDRPPRQKLHHVRRNHSRGQFGRGVNAAQLELPAIGGRQIDDLPAVQRTDPADVAQRRCDTEGDELHGHRLAAGP